MDAPEAPITETEQGFARTGEGWFVVNAREMRWYESKGWGRFSNFGGDILFDQLGIGVTVLGPDQDNDYGRFPLRTPVLYRGWMEDIFRTYGGDA